VPTCGAVAVTVAVNDIDSRVDIDVTSSATLAAAPTVAAILRRHSPTTLFVGGPRSGSASNAGSNGLAAW
jgi:hypothetical protein